jgi:hypothetical protein
MFAVSCSDFEQESAGVRESPEMPFVHELHADKRLGADQAKT